MISVDEINPDFEEEIEFFNLSNLALSCPRTKAHIDGINKPGVTPTTEVDRCNLIQPPTLDEFPNTCEEDPDCFRHVENCKYTCSSKSRRFDYADVSGFNHTHIIRETQRYRQLWCVNRDSDTMNLYFISASGKQIPIIMYCRIIQSERTGIVYVMFSSGVVLAGPDVVTNLHDYSVHIIQQVKRLVPGRICLCGHSMGATVSMAVAHHWFQEDTEYFMEHVKVIALGSINLFDHGFWFTGLPNIRSYLSTDSSNGIFVDPFCIRGDRSKQLYSPVKLILPEEVVEVDVDEVTFTSETEAMVSSSLIFYISQQHNYTWLHGLNTYISSLVKLAKKRGGKPKNRVQKKTFRKKINIVVN